VLIAVFQSVEERSSVGFHNHQPDTRAILVITQTVSSSEFGSPLVIIELDDQFAAVCRVVYRLNPIS